MSDIYDAEGALMRIKLERDSILKTLEEVGAQRDAAEEKLESLRSDIATVVGHLESYADWVEKHPNVFDKQRLVACLREDARRLLDVSEDTEKQSAGGDES